jgi:hypothetical protein
MQSARFFHIKWLAAASSFFPLSWAVTREICRGEQTKRRLCAKLITAQGVNQAKCNAPAEARGISKELAQAQNSMRMNSRERALNLQHHRPSGSAAAARA